MHAMLVQSAAGSILISFQNIGVQFDVPDIISVGDLTQLKAIPGQDTVNSTTSI